MERAAVTVSRQPSVVFIDGLGERRQIADPGGSELLEQLWVRKDLAAVPSFEFALRERVSRLATFRHAYYARVRGVERASDRDQTLTITSDAAPGIRMSELLARTEERRIPLDINAALCLIRQLVPAVAMLHETARDAAHGALGPERLIVTPTARLAIVEHVLGAALEQLRYSQERYWTDLRIALPRSPGLPRFDHRTDVTQIGVVALSLILGRALRDDEYPARVGDVVAATWAVSPRGGFEPLPIGLRAWLTRALQLDPKQSFASAIEARAELDKVIGDSDYIASPANLEAYLARVSSVDRPAPRIASSGPSPLASPVPPPAAPPAPSWERNQEVDRSEPAAPVAPPPVPLVKAAAAASPFITPPQPTPPPISAPAPAPSRPTLTPIRAQPPAVPAAPPRVPAPAVPPPPSSRVGAPSTSRLTYSADPEPAVPSSSVYGSPAASTASTVGPVAAPLEPRIDPPTQRGSIFELQQDPEPDVAEGGGRKRRTVWIAVAAVVVIAAGGGIIMSRRMLPAAAVSADTGTL